MKKKEASTIINEENNLSPNEDKSLTEVETTKNKKQKDPRNKLKYRTKDNDINYKAPLSYRHLRILGWVFLALSQIGLAFSIAQKVDTTSTFNYDSISNLISLFSTLPFAFFILANFGIILRNKNHFRYLFIFYGGIMAGLYVLANLVTIHYVYGTFRTISPGISFQEVAQMTGTFLLSMGNTGYMFNLFVDLFLCVLTVFFTFYYPKSKYFKGKKVLIFRSFVIIPIAYEVASLIIKQLCMNEVFLVPSYLFFLLTSKPPLTFGAFFAVTLILKIREYKFLKLYKYDYKLLEEHLSTNAHSFRTSITIAIVFVIAGTIDILALGGYTLFQFAKFAGEGSLDELSIMLAMSMGLFLGLGESTPLILIAPLCLLYSYTKTHKNKKIDSFIPFMGIGLVAFTLFESLYLSLRINILPMLFSPGEGEDTPEGSGDEFSIYFMSMKNYVYHIFHPVR